MKTGETIDDATMGRELSKFKDKTTEATAAASKKANL